MFVIDKKLNEDNTYIRSLELSDLLLNNNSNYLWLILVPRIENISELIDLDESQSLILNKEIKEISLIIKSIKPNCKLNIATIGNIVSQLHIHIIAREISDISWPKTVWCDSSLSVDYRDDDKKNIIDNIIKKINES